jgi:hypothetical protein
MPGVRHEHGTRHTVFAVPSHYKLQGQGLPWSSPLKMARPGACRLWSLILPIPQSRSCTAPSCILFMRLLLSSFRFASIFVISIPIVSVLHAQRPPGTHAASLAPPPPPVSLVPRLRECVGVGGGGMRRLAWQGRPTPFVQVRHYTRWCPQQRLFFVLFDVHAHRARL